MSKKTVSLQEFFRTNGPPGTYNNNLPVRPRRDSDDDQGLHLRLAQSCTLDSGKAYPQRYGSSSKGGKAGDGEAAAGEQQEGQQQEQKMYSEQWGSMLPRSLSCRKRVS